MKQQKTKICNLCGVENPVTGEYYHRHSHYKDGYRSICIECNKKVNLSTNTDESIKKKCTICNNIYPATEEYFYKYSHGKYGIMAKCKKCDNHICRTKNNPMNKNEEIKKKCTKCKMSLPATIDYFHREKAAIYGVNSICKKCKCKALKKRRNTDLYRKLSRIKMRNDPKKRLNRSISCSIRNSIKLGHKNKKHWESLVGFSLQELMKHLEKQFENGMTWENYGEWHIDHKIPISVFNYSEPEHIDFKKCWNLKNLQPMWATENISKSNKLQKPFQQSLALSIGGQ